MKHRVLRRSNVVAVALALCLGAAAARAEGPSAELAKQLANPLASLISVPFQYNHDSGIGPFDDERSVLNIQPVVPFALGRGEKWKVITRTIVPFVDHASGFPGASELHGVGDVTQSFFVTPARTGRGAWVVGLGPVIQMPTGSDAKLTSERWSAGPTAVALRQVGPWTYGVLANHMWSAGKSDVGTDINATFAQPFVNYVTRTRTTFALNTEATYDWQHETWSVPVHVIVNQLLKVGPQPVSVFVGARYWAESPVTGPEGWGLRAGGTLLIVPARIPGR